MDFDAFKTMDVQKDLEGDTSELMRVHDLYNMRSLNQRTIEKRHAQGLPDPDDDLLAEELAEWQEVSDLDMLRASRRLVNLLTGRRWYVIQSAREAGASWTEIGEALGISKQAAQQFYQRKIEAQEKYASDFHDAARARAVLEDDRP